MEDGSRIGILTFHRCINYGSYWQTMCLVEALRGMGLDPVVLDHDSPLVNVQEWRCALDPLLPVRSGKFDREQYACKVRRFLTSFEAMPLTPRFSIEAPRDAGEFDAIVVGSDEVWNLSHPWYANRGIFFGDGLRTKRLISYAASFGNFSCWIGIGSPWTDLLSRFDALSVRDENSWWMIHNSLGIDPAVCLDPCLFYPPRVEPMHDGRPYLAVYGHGFSLSFARQVREWAGQRGLEIVSIGYRNDWSDRNDLTADPLEFARIMAGSEAVATNFFHGCVFSLIYSKPFACEKTEYRFTKVENLLRSLGASDRFLQRDGRLGELLEQPVGADVQARIQRLREDSDRFLKESLLR